MSRVDLFGTVRETGQVGLISTGEFTNLESCLEDVAQNPSASRQRSRHCSCKGRTLQPIGGRRRSPRRRRVLAREILGPTIEVIWFGSWPRGRAHERSDVDIAIRCPAGVPRDRFRRLREAIDELPTLYSIDVVDLRDASPVLGEEVERDGRPI